MGRDGQRWVEGRGSGNLDDVELIKQAGGITGRRGMEKLQISANSDA